MSINDLNVIHENMLKDIHKNGGKIIRFISVLIYLIY